MEQYLNIVRNTYGQAANQPSNINLPTPSITPQDIIEQLNLNTPILPQPQEQPQSKVTNSDINSTLKYLEDSGIFKAENPKQTKVKDTSKKSKYTVGDYLKNNTYRGVINLATGLAYILQDLPQTVGKPLGERLANAYWEAQDNPLQATADLARDAANFLITEPLTGQSLQEIGTQRQQDTIQKFLDYQYGGGTLNSALVLAPTPIGRGVSKAIGKGVSKVINIVDDTLLKGLINERANIQQIKKDIKARNVLEDIELRKTNQKFSNDIKNMFKNYNIKETDFADMVKKMEGVEGKTLKDLTPAQREVYPKLNEILEEYNNVVQKYETATPDNVTEIVQHGVRRSQDRGVNTTYQDIEQAYKNQGFFDMGEYVNKDTGEVVKPLSYSRPIVGVTETSQKAPALSQILRRNGLREGSKPFNYDRAIKNIESKYIDSIEPTAQIDKALSRAEVEYKKLIDDLARGERGFVENDELIMGRFNNVVKDIPDEFKKDFLDRGYKDYEDIRNARFSDKPLRDEGAVTNPNRDRLIKDVITNARKYSSDIKNTSPLSTLNKKVKNQLREYLTPEEFTELLEADSTVGDLLKYSKQVSQEAIDAIKKPDLVQDVTTGEIKPIDLRNTKFVLPEESLEYLAELSLGAETPERAALAKQFLESYELSNNGELRRISHGLAPVDRTNVNPNKALAKINEENPLFSERVYGNAAAEDIATQWANPDAWLNRALTGILKRKTLNEFFNEYASTGKPIMSKNGRIEDVRYINRDILDNPKALKQSIEKAPAKLPEGVDASQYIPIDKNILKAYKELFYDKSARGKLVPFLEDLNRLFKTQLLASGNYLWGNAIGGIHALLTDSNYHIIPDVVNAIKSRGNLSRELGLNRNLERAMDTKLATPKSSGAYKPLRGLELATNFTGSTLLRNLDARLQNAVAETIGHSKLRQAGIPFENRNLEWLKGNRTKEQILDYINDIKNTSYIYGDETIAEKLLGTEKGKATMATFELANPFFRWVDQATQSSINLYKNHPVALGYIQGALLGNYAWDENKARAEGLGISNPQSGKMYKINPTGGLKITETEMIPILTTAKAIADPFRYTNNLGTSAGARGLMDIFAVKDKYGRLKERKDWKDITPDFRKQVRYDANGMVKEMPELDEIIAGSLNMIPYVQLYNKTLSGIESDVFNKPMYQRYNEQILTSPEGNPKKPMNVEKLVQRGLTNYSHGLIPGEDIPINPKQQAQLERQKIKRSSKADALRNSDKSIKRGGI